MEGSFKFNCVCLRNARAGGGEEWVKLRYKSTHASRSTNQVVDSAASPSVSVYLSAHLHYLFHSSGVGISKTLSAGDKYIDSRSLRNFCDY